MYRTKDHERAVSSIQWMQLIREDTIQDVEFLNTILQDLSELQEMESALIEEKERLDRNDNLSDNGRTRKMLGKVEAEVTPLLSNAQKKLAYFKKSTSNIIKDLTEYELSPDNTDTRSAIREQEIRAAFAGKSPDQIIQALRDAEKAEDTETLRAIEAAPPSIAVGDPDMIRRNRDERLRRRYPDEMQSFDDMQDAIEIYKTVESDLKNRLQTIQDIVNAKTTGNYDRIAAYNDEKLGRVAAE